ncbi:MAG: FIST C-terminal domain-containing protein, partial [Phycisphaeraceae bacterium]|nr:FIST C-terminal domain-containing protein [Phycisphaeraceae bacterium]
EFRDAMLLHPEIEVAKLTLQQTAIDFAHTLCESDDPRRAIDEAIKEIGAGFRDGRADVIFGFGSGKLADALPAFAQRARDALHCRAFLAGSASGLIGCGRELEHGGGLGALAIQGPDLELLTFSYPDIFSATGPDGTDRLRKIVWPAGMRQPRPSFIFLMADPFSTPTIRILPALNDAFPGVPVIGGMASHGRRPRSNRLVLNGQCFPEGAIGLAVGGNVETVTTVSPGCRPVGRPMVITRAKRHVVTGLSGMSALQAIQEMAEGLPEEDQELLRHQPLMVGRVITEYRERFGPGDFLIRQLVGVDQEAGSIAVGDPLVRVGQTVQFHIRDASAAEQDLRMLLQIQQLQGTPGGGLLFTCHGRGTQLYEHPNGDTRIIHKALGRFPLAGCFSAGEFGPVGNRNFLHGHTACLTVFRSPGAELKSRPEESASDTPDDS